VTGPTPRNRESADQAPASAFHGSNGAPVARR
jgi:hypothetical protein